MGKFLFAFIIILVFLSILGNFEIVEKHKKTTIDIAGITDIYVGYNFDSVFCNKESEACYWTLGGEGCKGKPIQYTWKSNFVGDPKSKYLSFWGQGTCVIERPYKTIGIRWF